MEEDAKMFTKFVRKICQLNRYLPTDDVIDLVNVVIRDPASYWFILGRNLVQATKQASLFAQLINKDIISMNNVQGQAVRKAHKAQVRPTLLAALQKNLTKNQTNKHVHVQYK